MFRSILLALLIVVFLSTFGVRAQKKKEEKKEEPRVIVALPLAVPAGAVTKVKVRGLKLENVKELRFVDARHGSWKVLKKSKVGVPNKQVPERVGDSEVQAEVTVAAGLPVGGLPFIAVTNKGESKPHSLLVGSPLPLIKEKQGDNNGFRQAQPIQVGQMIEGSISGGQDVDVFRLEGKTGQNLLVELEAARHGSALDGILTIYDENAQLVASNDDAEPSGDARLEITLKRDGAYFISLIDAHDQGGPTHLYRLSVREKSR